MDLDRHIAKVHPDLKERNLSDTSSDESGWRTNDPGDLIDEDTLAESLEQAIDTRKATTASASLEDGHTDRKATAPVPVFAPPRRSVLANHLKRKAVFDLNDSSEPHQGYSRDKSLPRPKLSSEESSVTERDVTATRSIATQT